MIFCNICWLVWGLEKNGGVGFAVVLLELDSPLSFFVAQGGYARMSVIYNVVCNCGGGLACFDGGR